MNNFLQKKISDQSLIFVTTIQCSNKVRLGANLRIWKIRFDIMALLLGRWNFCFSEVFFSGKNQNVLIQILDLRMYVELGYV